MCPGESRSRVGDHLLLANEQQRRHRHHTQFVVREHRGHHTGRRRRNPKMLQTVVHQLEHGPRIHGSESQPPHERVHREPCGAGQHQHPAQTELPDHRQEAAGRQQHQPSEARRCSHRVVERQPSAERHAHEADAVEMQRIQRRRQPGRVVCGVSYRLGGNALARLTHDIHGIDSMVLAEIRDVGRPHRRCRPISVEQHQRWSLFGTTDDHVRRPEPRRNVDLVVRNRPPLQRGVIGREIGSFTLRSLERGRVGHGSSPFLITPRARSRAPRCRAA